MRKVLAALLVAMAGCGLFSNDKTTEDGFCTPGAYVFCRCADHSPGTKLCKADAKSYEPCMTSADGQCVGGEVPDPQTDQPVPAPPDASTDPNAAESCPGKSITLIGGVEKQIEGDTSTATGDRVGRDGGACAGASAHDHVYRLTAQGSGRLEVKVAGSDGLDPIAYLETKCGDAASQASCGPSTPQKVAQLSTNILKGTDYFLIVDGASGSTGKYVATLKLTTGPFCGDGSVDPGEACDDGNHDPNDGCDPDCHGISGDPPSGGSCPGQPVTLWDATTISGNNSTTDYDSTWNAPTYTCSYHGTNDYPDHIYEVTPQTSGNLSVWLAARTGTLLPNLMVSARPACTSTDGATEAMCANDGRPGYGETLVVPVKAGTKIYVGVDGGGVTNNRGDYVISFKVQ